MVQVDGVHKWVGEGHARTDILRGVSLSVFAGEFAAIMGASGSGKSTLLNLIGLLDNPSAGTVRLMNKDASALSDDEQAELRGRSIGFVFQSFNLLPYLNARENIELGMAYAGHPHPRERAAELLGQVGLDHRADAYPGTLSGGERQRVAIARALANRPALILADEPTGALDSKTGAQIIDLLNDLHHQGTTVVLVTHDETIARRTQRIFMMKDGRLEKS